MRTGGRIMLVTVADIDWIEAYDDYARLHVAGRRMLVAERMRQLEASLDPARFVRIHRSALVNVARVRELYHHSHGDYVVVLADGIRLRMTRSRRHVLLKRAGTGGEGSGASPGAALRCGPARSGGPSRRSAG